MLSLGQGESTFRQVTDFFKPNPCVWVSIDAPSKKSNLCHGLIIENKDVSSASKFILDLIAFSKSFI